MFSTEERALFQQHRANAFMRSSTTSATTNFASSITAVLAMVALMVGFIPGEAAAQQGGGPDAVVTKQGGISYSAAIPVGEFDDAVGRTSNGVDLYAGVKAGSLPL
jgi:anti-sigma-K factor RskA